MIELQINTTQNVNLNFTAASVGERILAYIIDWLIKGAYLIVIYQIIFNIFQIDRMFANMDQWSVLAILLLFYLPVMFYSLVLEVWLDGQTIGKRVMKIQVVKIDGYQASLADFVVRWFLRIVDVNMLLGMIGLTSMVASSRNQRLGDITAGTAVISLKNKVNISHTILEELNKNYQPTYPSVIRLSDNDARIIKETFTTARASKDYKTMIKLRSKIMEVLELKEKVHNRDHEFIATILKDYNYYTQNM